MDTTMPQNVRVRLNVGGATFQTSLHTLMQGARQGSAVFQCLCAQILGRATAAGGDCPEDALQGRNGLAWEQRVVPAQAEQYKLEHFIDADPTPFPIWLEYLRTGRIPFVDEKLMDRIILDTEDVGFADLAAGLRSVSPTKQFALHSPSAKGAHDLDEDWVALLHEYGLHDKADSLADNGICSAMDLHHMFESDVQQLRKDLKLSYSFNALWNDGQSACAHIHEITTRREIYQNLSQNQSNNISKAIEVVMCNHKRRTPVLKKGFEALVFEILLANNRPDEILRISSAHKGYAGLQLYSLRALSRIYEERVGYGGEVDAVLEVILEEMCTHNRHVGVQNEGLRALSCLMDRGISGTKGSQGYVSVEGRVVKRGGIKVILEAMNNFKSVEDVQGLGCRVLNHLAIDHSSVIVNEEGIQVIIDAMSNHKSSAEVQHQGCWALRKVSKDDYKTENRTKIMEQGGVKAIIDAMRNHKTDAQVQVQGCRALHNIGISCSRIKIAEQGGIKVVLEAISNLKHECEVQVSGCITLSTLASDLADSQITIVEQGGVALIVDAMRKHKSVPEVQENGCWALMNIGDKNPDLLKQISRSGAEETVKVAMQASNATYNTRQKGKVVLDRLVAWQAVATAEHEELDATAAQKMIEEGGEFALGRVEAEAEEAVEDDNHEDLLAVLESMGWNERARNLALLAKHRNNVEAALNELLG